MIDFEPGDFGEKPAGDNGSDAQVEQCPHCGKPINTAAAVCPHCKLPLDGLIQVDLNPELFPRQRLRRMLRPQAILIAVFTVAVILGSYGFFVIQQFSSDYYIETGDRLMTEGDSAAAAEYYRQAVQFAPQDPLVFERLGWAEYQLALDVDALKNFEKALSLSPDRVASLYGAGLAAYRLRDYENSSLYMHRLLETSPGHVGAHEYLGLAEYRLGKYEAAYEHLNKAWIYNPQNATTAYYQGRILAQRGDADLAIQNFDQAEKLGFDAGSITYARGLAWMQVGNYELARDDLQKALIAFPMRKDVILSLAKAFYLLADYQAAQTQLTTIQADVPSDLQADYLALSGWVSLRQGYPAAALNAFNLWLNLDPNNEQALNALGWAAYYSDDCGRADFYFESARQLQTGEWIFSNESLAALDETPQAGLELQCPGE